MQSYTKQELKELIAEGYQLVTVTELLTSKDRTIEPGGLYYKR